MCRLILFATRIVAVLLAATFLLSGQATAQESGNLAGLVVVHNDGRVSYAVVQFSEESLSGVELLKRSGFEVTEVAFGGLGIGVCSIDETGCDVSVCRQRVCQGPKPDDPYWQYFLANPDGSWSASALGISADTVNPNDVRAFIWSVDPPNFPAARIAEVQMKAVDQVADDAWLTRYAADGSVIGDASDDADSVPVAASLLVVLAAIGLVVVVARNKAIGHSK